MSTDTNTTLMASAPTLDDHPLHKLMRDVEEEYKKRMRCQELPPSFKREMGWMSSGHVMAGGRYGTHEEMLVALLLNMAIAMDSNDRGLVCPEPWETEKMAKYAAETYAMKRNQVAMEHQLRVLRCASEVWHEPNTTVQT